MNKISNFVKEVKGRLTGNDSDVISAKNERKANSAVNGQLAALKAKLVDDESTVEDAEEALKNALYPTSLISDNTSYVKGIKSAQERLDTANQTLTDTKDSITYYEGVLTKFAEQVEA